MDAAAVLASRVLAHRRGRAGLGKSVVFTRTFPVERKYCARATTNSWAGTSFTVRGAFGMIAAILRKVRARAKQKGLAMRTARGFLRQVFVSRVRERVYV
jgi:hypothetical protein